MLPSNSKILVNIPFMIRWSSYLLNLPVRALHCRKKDRSSRLPISVEYSERQRNPLTVSLNCLKILLKFRQHIIIRDISLRRDFLGFVVVVFWIFCWHMARDWCMFTAFWMKTMLTGFWAIRNNLNGTDIGKRCTKSQIKKIKKTCRHVKLKKITSLFFPYHLQLLPIHRSRTHKLPGG